MNDLVTIDINSAGVADVRLNRPDKYNALSPAMFDAITDAGESLLDDKSVRAVVISGNGRGFCAGLDFSGFRSMAGDTDGSTGEARRKSTGRTPGNAAQQPGMVWKKLPVPVIAAIHGVAYGGGFQIAMGADIRIATADARFSVMEIKWGLIPDCSLTQTLRDLVRLDIAKELTFTARRIGGEEAVGIGLATHCVDDPLAAATELAEEIATKSPSAVRAAKKLLTRAYSADPIEGLKLEEGIQRTLLGSANQMEAVKANMEKRIPEFEDVE